MAFSKKPDFSGAAKRKLGKHPGFQAVESKIQGEGYSKDAAGAILAAASRKASSGAKASNPRLNRVKG